MLMYAGGGSRAAQLFRSPKLVCWINRLSGGALVMLAGALAFYRRAHN
jgi:threonine/homoserine/homoserine lactone efflux protein